MVRYIISDQNDEAVFCLLIPLQLIRLVLRGFKSQETTFKFNFFTSSDRILIACSEWEEQSSKRERESTKARDCHTVQRPKAEMSPGRRMRRWWNDNDQFSCIVCLTQHNCLHLIQFTNVKSLFH